VLPKFKTWPATLLLFLAAAPFSAASAQETARSDVYTINPGDEIEVYVWGDTRLQRTIRVLPDGSFSFPLAGRIVAQGLKPSEVEAAVSKALTSQYNGEPPQVTVSVQQASGYVFSVVGRVRGAGTFSPGRYINVLEAVALAGGPDEFANIDNVTILRKSAKGLTAERVRLGGAMKGNLSGAASGTIPEIQVGDTVIVP
jgi:polysaccharide biosynthesis/export protein